MEKRVNQSWLAELERFEPDVFWEQHQRKVIGVVIGLLVIGLAVFYWQKQQQEVEARAASQLAAASDSASLQRFLQDYPGSKTAPVALVRLSKELFEAGQLPEAAAALQRVINEFPQSSLVEAARLGLAAIAEAQGNLDVAKAAYAQLATNPNGQVAGLAKLGLARCAEASGQAKEAKQLYEELMMAGSDSPLAQAAYLRMTVLGRSETVSQTIQDIAPQTVVP